MNRIFFLLLPLLFISGCVAEPGHVVYFALSGLWGLYFATYLINRLINNAKEKKKYILTIIVLILSFVAPAFVANSGIEDISVAVVVVVVVGVISFLLFSPIAFIVSYILEANAYDKTKDRFPILLTIMLLIYLLIPCYLIFLLI